MEEGICKFCKKKLKLVKSHIIPEGLYWQLTDSQERPAKMLSPLENEYPKKRPNGFYAYFLCDEHEKQFNDWDTYACNLLRDSIPGSTNNGLIFKNVQYQSIKLFFISMLWRAHCAEIEFFDRVQLGPHADRIKKLIENKDPSFPEKYSIVLWRSDELFAKAVMAPYRQKYEGISFYHFYLPGYKVLLKVDKKENKGTLLNS